MASIRGVWWPKTRLSNGKHKLVLIADANASTGSTNRGLLVVPFTVRN
jgi:hypothetical protein